MQVILFYCRTRIVFSLFLVIENNEIVYRQYVDLSIAVATPKGLVVPVMRNVQLLNYAQIEKMMVELGAKVFHVQNSLFQMFSKIQARDNKLAIEVIFLDLYYLIVPYVGYGRWYLHN